MTVRFFSMIVVLLMGMAITVQAIPCMAGNMDAGSTLLLKVSDTDEDQSDQNTEGEEEPEYNPDDEQEYDENDTYDESEDNYEEYDTENYPE